MSTLQMFIAFFSQVNNIAIIFTNIKKIAKIFEQYLRGYYFNKDEASTFKIIMLHPSIAIDNDPTVLIVEHG